MISDKSQRFSVSYPKAVSVKC